MYLKGHSHWPILDQFQHHGLLTAAPVKTTHVAILCGVNAAAVSRHATRGILSDVRKARLLHNAEILSVLPNEVGKPAITTLKGRRWLEMFGHEVVLSKISSTSNN